MTRAEYVLQMAEAVMKTTPPGNPYRNMWSYSPGAKVPMHIKRRKQQSRDLAIRRKQAYTKPWAKQSDNPKDKSSSPLSSQRNETPVSRTG